MPALHINPFHQQKKMEKEIFANTLGDDYDIGNTNLY